MIDPTKLTADERQAALANIAAIYDDKCAEINGNKYELTMTSHPQRVKVFSYLTKIQTSMQHGDLSFLDTKEFADVEKVINNVVTFDGSLLSRLPTHWDEYPEDYIPFITMIITVISYPFLRGKSTA